MNDERIRRLIQAELAGEISPENEAELQQALAENPDLKAIYGEERGLSALFARDRESIETPPGLEDRIIAGVLGDRARGRRLDFPRFARIGAAAAAILLVVGVSFWSGRRSTSATPDLSLGGLVERRDQLLRDLPEAERDAVSAAFAQAIERLRELDRRHEDERSRILEQLENAVGEKLGNRRDR